MINVLIADDHQIVVDGLIAVLNEEQDIQIVARSKNGKEALSYIENNAVDIAILDIRMPEMDGIEVTKAIKQQQIDTKVLILSMYDESEYIYELLEAGCSGYILKNKGQEELVKAIRTIEAGEEHFGKAVIAQILKERKTPKSSTVIPVNLTNREKEILAEITIGQTTPEIAKKLHIAETTVDTHRRNMIGKLGLRNSLELVRYGVKNGYDS